MTTEVALEPVIGLEVHAQLLTDSKMFCGCSSAYANAAPNTHTCAVCAGMPGALPVINRRAVEFTIMTARTLHCTVPEHTKFDRKNYSYPDLPKGYQITQFDQPLGEHGWIEFGTGDERVRCRIRRVHLEEDTGKSTHTDVDGREVSLVDYNRSGVPLMEIVSEPDLHSPEAAREYFSTLRQILVYLGVNDGNLQEGSMRADVNVSLRQPGGELGTKVEIKNLNSFRAVQRALEYEIERQRRVLASGGTLEQETRGWSERTGETMSQRTKEYAHDYRYFPEPDLPPLFVSRDTVRELEDRLPELAEARARRFQESYGLNEYTAHVLTLERPLADYYEQLVAIASDVPPAFAANWVTQDLLRLLNDTNRDISDSLVTPGRLARLLTLVHEGTVSNTAGKHVLEIMFGTGEDAGDIVRREDLAQIGDANAIRQLVDEVLTANPPLVEKYRSGKTNVSQALVGKVMQASKGKANPQVVRGLVEEALKA